MKMMTLLLGLGLMAAMVLPAPASANGAAVKALNEIRADNGRGEVSYSKKLEAAARRHARDMARRGKLSHRGSDGSKFTQRTRDAGYRACYQSENIAQGTKTLAQTLQIWWDSRPHRRNMLHRKARQFGIARKGDYWVIVLAQPC